MSDTTPQVDDPVRLTLALPPTTEEWAETLLGEIEGVEVQRSENALTVVKVVHGNVNAIVSARYLMDEVEQALAEGEIDPMSFTLVGMTNWDAPDQGEAPSEEASS